MPTLHTETFLRCSADGFYDSFKRNMDNLPQYLPQTYKSIRVVEGDGMNMGTIRHWKYVIGGNIFNLKEAVEDLDEENRSITFKVLEGDIMNLYNSFRFKVHVTPLGEDVCSVQWTVVFVKAHERVPTPNTYLAMCAEITTEIGHRIN